MSECRRHSECGQEGVWIVKWRDRGKWKSAGPFCKEHAQANFTGLSRVFEEVSLVESAS